MYLQDAILQSQSLCQPEPGVINLKWPSTGQTPDLQSTVHHTSRAIWAARLSRLEAAVSDTSSLLSLDWGFLHRSPMEFKASVAEGSLKTREVKFSNTAKGDAFPVPFSTLCSSMAIL